MMWLLIGLFIGSAISLILYSTIAGERINDLEHQNEQMIFELERKEKELATYRCMYASSYEGFEETK